MAFLFLYFLLYFNSLTSEKSPGIFSISLFISKLYTIICSSEPKSILPSLSCNIFSIFFKLVLKVLIFVCLIFEFLVLRFTKGNILLLLLFSLIEMILLYLKYNITSFFMEIILFLILIISF